MTTVTQEEEMTYLYGTEGECFHAVPSLILRSNLISRHEAQERGLTPCVVCYGAERKEPGEPLPDLRFLEALRERTAALRLIPHALP